METKELAAQQLVPSCTEGSAFMELLCLISCGDTTNNKAGVYMPKLKAMGQLIFDLKKEGMDFLACCRPIDEEDSILPPAPPFNFIHACFDSVMRAKSHFLLSWPWL